MIAAWWNPLDWVRNAAGALGGVVSDAANGLLGDIFEWLASLLIRGVIWLFNVVYDFVSTQTTPDLTAAWFVADGKPMAIAGRLFAMLLMLFVILAIAEAVWHRDGGQLLRAIGQDAPKVLLLNLSLVFLVGLGLAVADGVSGWFLGLFGTDIELFTMKMAEVTSSLQFGTGVLVVVLVALFLVLVLAFVALELIFRQSFIVVLVPICAILLATEVYRPTKGMGGRAVRLLIVTIAAKPMIALCLAAGAAALGAQAANVSVDAIDVPGGVREITSEQYESWRQAEARRLVTSDWSFQAVALSTQEWERLLTAERCCGQLRVVFHADSWRVEPDPAQPTRVVGGSQGIDAVDTAAVAPTFGLVMTGLATMMLAAFSPFVLMRLISTDPGASTGEARTQVGGSAKTAGRSAGKVGSALGRKGR